MSFNNWTIKVLSNLSDRHKPPIKVIFLKNNDVHAYLDIRKDQSKSIKVRHIWIFHRSTVICMNNIAGYKIYHISKRQLSDSENLVSYILVLGLISHFWEGNVGVFFLCVYWYMQGWWNFIQVCYIPPALIAEYHCFRLKKNKIVMIL